MLGRQIPAPIIFYLLWKDIMKYYVPQHKIIEVKQAHDSLKIASNELQKARRKRELAHNLFWDMIHEYAKAPENANLRYDEKIMAVSEIEDDENPLKRFMDSLGS